MAILPNLRGIHLRTRYCLKYDFSWYNANADRMKSEDGKMISQDLVFDCDGYVDFGSELYDNPFFSTVFEKTTTLKLHVGNRTVPF